MDLSSLKTSYVILRELGRGGMGVVFQAWDRRLERHVALKIINLTSADEASENDAESSMVSLFLQEAKAVARLNHPNIVTLFDIGGSKGRYFLVMEYIEGYGLDILLQQLNQVGADMVMQIGIQLCDALDSAHRQGIVHRDIKPANVLLNGEGNIKLMDFGIAEIHRESRNALPEAQLLGSVLYMSPEQMADANQADQRSDLYSVGVTLYELLCGARPFQDKNIAQLIRHIMVAPAPVFAEHGIEVPPELEKVILKALAKDPAARFQSAAEMSAALTRVRAGGNAEPPAGEITRQAPPQPLTVSQAQPSSQMLRDYVGELIKQVNS
ncbi:MAG TPA: serine/threonine-protein kinase [Candidatus Obscuribacterales bacterium]